MLIQSTYIYIDPGNEFPEWQYKTKKIEKCKLKTKNKK